MTRRDRRGASALEFALLLPVFVVLLTATIDLGWLFYQRSAIASAAALGCRAGALVDPGVDDVWWEDLEAAVQTRVEETFAATGAPCDLTGDCVTAVEAFGEDPGRSIGCSVSRGYTPLVGMVIPSMTLSYRMVVRLEWQR